MDEHELRGEMEALFSKFLPVEIAARFSGLLAMKPDNWSKIDPWKVWDVVDGRRVAEWTKTSAELLASPLFAKHANDLVTVLRCGHEQPELARIRLRESLLGRAAVFEGVISILPGRLGIVINHDEMICVLRETDKQPLTRSEANPHA
jgi:hypothetical protein